MNKDLTTGKPEKVLWQFCLPLFGSIIFQQLYNIADSFVAGKFISDNALAAVGNSYEITLIFIAFAFGCNIACSVLAALFFGAKQYNDLEFIQCACRFTENCTMCDNGGGGSKRQEVKILLRRLRRDNPNIERSIFNSIHSVNLDMMPGYKTGGVLHSFLENYDGHAGENR